MNDFNEHNKEGLVYLTIPSYDKIGIKHAFTTRLGGVSENEFSSLNLGFGRGDLEENVYQNYERLSKIMNRSVDDFVLSKQTHNDNIAIITSKDKGTGITKAGFEDVDGLITNENGIVLCCFFADCVPIMLYDPIKKVCGIIHSGWKGTAKSIGAKAVKLMKEHFGSDAEHILVGIGPSIGQCHFEVDSETANILKNVCSDSCAYIQKDDKYFVDLWLINKYILKTEGIKEENITISGECTYCLLEKYYSHRKMGTKRGSLAAVITLD